MDNIAIKSADTSTLIFNFDSFKRDLLLFDKIFIPNFGESLPELGSSIPTFGLSEEGKEKIKYSLNELEWLYGQGLLIDSIESLPRPHKEMDLNISLKKAKIHELFYQTFYKILKEEYKIDIYELNNKSKKEPFKEYYEALEKAYKKFEEDENFFTMGTAMTLNSFYGSHIVPIVSKIPTFFASDKTTHQDAIKLVIKKLPIPGYHVPWVQILDFKNDPDNKLKFIELRRWIAKISKNSTPTNELEEELDYLILSYEKQMRLHKLQSNYTSLEFYISGLLDVFPDILKLNWGKIAKKYFSFKKEKMELKSKESQFPGKEISYIVKANEEFNRST